jgi:hypothetical protein
MASIFEDSKVSGILGNWVVWIHEVLEFYQLSLVRVRPINLVHLLHLRNKWNRVEMFLCKELSKSMEYLENLLMETVQIDFCPKWSILR